MIVVVLGGARSGKSHFAQQRAGASGDHVTYIATARRGDPELDSRIARHRQDRPSSWSTREVEGDLAAAIGDEPADRTLIVDSIGLWLGTLLESDDDPTSAWPPLARALAARRMPVILVSEDVGSGLVPGTPLGRRFRDELGFLNQRLVALADEAFLMVAGIPLALRSV